jgi:hypothetical protein
MTPAKSQIDIQKLGFREKNEIHGYQMLWSDFFLKK